MRIFSREKAVFLLGAVGVEAGLLFIVFLGDLRPQITLFWSGLLVAFLSYLLCAFRVCRKPGCSLVGVFVAAIVFRLTLLGSQPSLSDDVYRYVWDGRVQLSGINPYLHPPSAPELEHLRDEFYPGINHKDVPTVYPPVTQFYFRLVCSLAPAPTAMKCGLALFEFGIVLLLVGILRQRRQDGRRVLIYAWNPLPVIEVAGSGHSDALGVFFLMLSLYALNGGRRSAAVWALAAASLVKFVPVLALAAFWRRMGSSWFELRRRWCLLWFPALAAAAYLPFAGAGEQLIAGLKAYAYKWRFNDALFSIVLGVSEFLNPGPDGGSLMLAKWICAGVLLLVVLWTALRCSDVYRTLFAVMGAWLLLMPVLHPWYLMWILPFLPLFPRPSWILFSGLAFLAYEVLIGYSRDGTWQEQTWVKWAQYGPFYFLLVLYPAYRRWRADR